MTRAQSVSVLVALGAVGFLGWTFARDISAARRSSEYLEEKRIPIYHEISLHVRTRNAKGYCRPCGEAALQALRERLDVAALTSIDAARKD